MKKIFLVKVLVLVLLLSFFGCATMPRKGLKDNMEDECASLDPEVESELRIAKQIIEKARLEGADQRCPKAYQEVIDLWNKAKESNKSSQFKQAISKARAAREKAQMLCPDSDKDGVSDEMDQCPDTPKGIKVDDQGCPIDSDGDGVPDSLDKCPDTQKGVKVDSSGCPIDSDSDGVADYLDKCPNTPRSVKVDKDGCPIDSDNDGVADYLDRCPRTPRGVKVDAKGCPLDSDGDGVADYLDKCPGTPKGVKVDATGCLVCQDIEKLNLESLVNFDFDKSVVKPQFNSVLDKVVDCLKKQTSVKVEIQGYTCNIGTKEYNQGLSEKRANMVLEYFLKKGVAKEQLSAVGYGLTKPIASNATREGRAQNRRVQLKLTY